MMYGIYSIRDSVADSFLQIMTDINDKTATRNFEHACMTSNSMFYTHPSDYFLYKLGEFDSESGNIIAYDVPKLIICADQFKEVSNE